MSTEIKNGIATTRLNPKSGGGGGGASDWSELQNKPFSTLNESDFDVHSGELRLRNAPSALFVESEGEVVIEGFVIPSLTAEQITNAYNAVVAGRGCVIVDKDNIGNFTVNQVDSLNGEISVEILYYNSLLVTYTADGDNVNVAVKKLDASRVEIVTVGESGFLSPAQVQTLQDGSVNAVIINDSKAYVLANKQSEGGYMSFFNVDSVQSNPAEISVIYVQVEDESAGQYGSWERSVVPIGAYLKYTEQTLSELQKSQARINISAQEQIDVIVLG